MLLEPFLRALASLLPAPLRGVATPVVDRLLAVWRWSQSLAQRARGGLGRVVDMARGARTSLVRLASEVYTTLRWLLLVRVPALVGQARDTAIRWAGDRVRELTAALAGARALMVRGLAVLRAELRELIDSLRRWALDQISAALALARALRERVFGLWATPERLAAWLVGAMWAALWRHASGQMEAIAEALWVRRQRIALRVLADAERIIGRLL